MRRFGLKVRLETGLEEAYAIIGEPSTFLGLLEVFRKIKKKNGNIVSAVLPVTVHGSTRMLRVDFAVRREPPYRVSYTGEGDARIHFVVNLRPAAGGAEAKFSVEVSAHTLVEPIVASLISRALKGLGTKLSGTAAVAPAPLKEGFPGIEDLSMRLADPLMLSELVMGSRYLESFTTTLVEVEERARKLSANSDDILYIVALSDETALRILAWRGEVLAAVYEGTEGSSTGREALAKAREAIGVEARVTVFLVDRSAAARIFSQA